MSDKIRLGGRALMVGPIGGVITGQSVAFQESCRGMPGSFIVDTSFETLGSLVSYPMRLLSGLLLTGGTVYFTSSRTRAGFFVRDLPLLVLSRMFRRRVVNHLHGNDFLSFRTRLGPLSRWLVDIMYRTIAVSCAPASMLLDQYSIYPNMKTQIVPNFFGDDIGKYPFCKSTDGPLKLLYLSNFIPAKGFPLAIEAADMLVAQGVPVELTLCGAVVNDGVTSRESITKFLDEQRRKPYINVRGAVSGIDKVRQFAAADIFLLPTTYPTEAAPISIIEALAGGCFVITTRQGAIPEVVEGFLGMMVDPAPQAIVNAVFEFISSSERSAVPIFNRSRAADRYSAAAYRERIRSIVNA